MRLQRVSMPMSQIHGKIAIEATHKRLTLCARLRFSPIRSNSIQESNLADQIVLANDSG
jgi:hypothetical protein